MSNKSRIDIIYEDNHLLIVNKPSGVLVQGDRTGDVSLVDECKEYIKRKYNKPGEAYLGLVHRLDRPVSGVVILTKTSKALDRMNEQFRNRQVDKFYWAITNSAPTELEGTLTHWLVKDPKKNTVTAFNKMKKDALKAELKYRVIGRIGNNYLIEIKLITGRFHQIRVQLKSIGCPVIGDVKYGYDKPNQDGSICLHARKVEFIHPVKKEPLILEACLPKSEQWKKFNSF